MLSVWQRCGRIVGRIIRPWMREREFSYYDRPYCVWPRLRTTDWGANHVVCGEPVANTIDLAAVTTMTEILGGGHSIGDFPPGAPIGGLMILPKLLGALSKGPLAPVCEGHLAGFWRDVADTLELAEPGDQERFKEWLKQRPISN